METKHFIILCVAVVGLVQAGKHDIYSRFAIRRPLLDIGLPQKEGFAIIATLGKRVGDRSVVVKCIENAAAHSLVSPLVAFYDTHGKKWGGSFMSDTTRDKHSVYNVEVRNKTDQKLLHDLELQLDLDIWQHGVAGKRDAQIMVKPEKKAEFLQTLDVQGLGHSVHLEDVAEAFEIHDQEMTAWRASKTNRWIFQDYPRYAEVDAYLEKIAREYPNLVTLVNAEKSFEGRDIKYLKISTTNFQDKSKPVYVMTTMIHSREWVTTPVALYSIYRLVENLRSEDSDLLSDIDWIILPLVNPDGYEFTHTTQRLWRKTRSFDANNHATCFGTDGNRNFGKDWATIGVSANPCSDIYPGPSAFSEAEVRNMRNIMLENLERIQLFMDIHSFGKYVTFGYGDESLPPNAAQLHQVGSAMGAMIDVNKLPEAGFYVVGNSASLMYVTSGCAQDYGQSIGIPFSYTLELPSYGYDFRVPPQYVDQINEETWHGIAISARLSRSFYRARYNAAATP